MSTQNKKLILASGSKSRAQVLTNAGVIFTQTSPDVDEHSTKTTVAANSGTAAACAEILAEMKAVKISVAHPSALVIGCDQMLDCVGVWFDKPKDLSTARTQLRALRGKRHSLFNSMVVAQGGMRIWHHADRADLDMRNFSDAFLDDYLEKVGQTALLSVGGYQLEGQGAQLFNVIYGDFFSILGLPLLPLLGFLREHRAIET